MRVRYGFIGPTEGVDGGKPLLADKLDVNGTAALTDILASPQKYEQLLGALKERIRTAQLDALRVVNQGLITLYMDIGRMIVERQQGDTWGKSVVANLARDLREEFPGANGFSAANLWRMKVFYEAYGEAEKLAQLVREIGWSHNITILEKCKSDGICR